MAMQQLKKLSVLHQSMIDYSLMYPWASQYELAKEFKVSDVSVSQIRRSTVFRQELLRRKRRVSDAIDERLIKRAEALINKSLSEQELAMIISVSEVIREGADNAIKGKVRKQRLLDERDRAIEAGVIPT